MNALIKNQYLNCVIYFNQGTGCIPPEATCYCYRVVGEYYWVRFKYPVLGMYDIKIHKDVIRKHGQVVLRD